MLPPVKPLLPPLPLHPLPSLVPLLSLPSLLLPSPLLSLLLLLVHKLAGVAAVPMKKLIHHPLCLSDWEVAQM